MAAATAQGLILIIEGNATKVVIDMLITCDEASPSDAMRLTRDGVRH
jgi:hypothetical protein